MINSVFSVDLSTTNNQYKPPFITSLQVIYKYAGLPFGQLWLSTLFVSFLVFLYHAMSLYIHRLLSGIFLVFFLVIPEMYAYTFMARLKLQEKADWGEKQMGNNLEKAWSMHVYKGCMHVPD